MDESKEDRLDDIVEAQLRYLRGQGPRPNIAGLDEDERAEVVSMLEIVEALAGSLPASPPFEEDPVAIRLGLVDEHAPTTRAVEAIDGDDPVQISLGEVAARFDENAVRIERLSEPLEDAAGNRAHLICRSLAEAVAVFVFEDEPPTLEDAAVLFAQRAELSAIAFSSVAATQAAVVTPVEVGSFLVPGVGWRDPGELSWDPLGIALGRHFERSTPRWDRVLKLPMSGPLSDVANSAVPIAEAELAKVARSRPQLAHKQDARDFVANREVTVFTESVEAVRSGRLPVERLAGDLAEMCEVAS